MERQHAGPGREPFAGLGRLGPYVAMARPEHWTKHVFMVPGVIIALVIFGLDAFSWPRTLLGFGAASLLASANYVINDWFDAETDRHHPLKANRAAAAGLLSARWVAVEYSALAAAGLALAFLVSPLFIAASAAFLASGIVYNLRPLRTKDVAYWDVATEAINNPIRLVLGRSTVVSDWIPPVSAILVFWAGGAFLMATKRLAEYRYLRSVTSIEEIARYRRSFASYDDGKILISCFAYAFVASFAIAIFLVKYRAEYVLLFPLLALLFSYYLNLGLRTDDVVQAPEKFLSDAGLVAIVAVLGVAFLVLAVVDIPLVEAFVDSRVVAVGGR